MALKHSYSLLAPIYDPIVARASESMRRKSLHRLGDISGKEILLAGVGTGLDLPLLPPGATYTGIDITPAMLRYAQKRIPPELDIRLEQGDVMAMPYADNQFDIVLMHLILAVVPQPERALYEATRVARPGGRIVILDKFLKPGQLAPLRRLLNLVFKHIATRTDVVFENLLSQTPSLQLQHDEEVIPGGWFRSIELVKQHN